MAKCVHCGKNVGLFNPGFALSYDESICNKCWKSLGFDEADKSTFGGRSYAFIKNGKARCLEIWAEAEKKAEKLHEATFPVVGTSYENEDGRRIQQVLKEILAEYSTDQYDGMSNKEIREDGIPGERIYRYETQDVEADVVETEFDGAPAYKIYALEPERIHVGWIPKDKIKKFAGLQKKRTEYVLSIYGGEYKILTDDDEVEKDSTDYAARLTVVYEE